MEKAGTPVPDDTTLEIRSKTTPFVGRAGQKLHHAFETFGLSVKQTVCLDVGASTGGFTDCLLQNGAGHVFAVDVGYGQIDSKLRAHPRVTVVDRCNARHLQREALLSQNGAAARIEFVCMDVSFISLRRIVEPLRKNFPELRTWVLLFKPQFEVGPKNLGKGGRVKSEELTLQALADFRQWIEPLGLIEKHPPSASPLAGKKSGNVEYLLHYEAL